MWKLSSCVIQQRIVFDPHICDLIVKCSLSNCELWNVVDSGKQRNLVEQKTGHKSSIENFIFQKISKHFFKKLKWRQSYDSVPVTMVCLRPILHKETSNFWISLLICADWHRTENSIYFSSKIWKQDTMV